MNKIKNPTSWSEITIGQYQEIIQIETDNDLSRFIQTIAIVKDVDTEDIRNLPLNEWKELAEEMKWLKIEPQADITERFTIDGVEYGLEPDLSIMSTGVFIDAEQFRRDTAGNLHRTLAMIYRPIISEDASGYKIAPHEARGFEKRANLFRDRLSPELVVGAVVFFSLLGVELSIVSLEYLKDKLEMTIQKKMIETQKASKKGKEKRSKKNSDSTTQSSK